VYASSILAVASNPWAGLSPAQGFFSVSTGTAIKA